MAVKLLSKNYIIATLDKDDFDPSYIDWLNNPLINKYLDLDLSVELKYEHVKKYIAEKDNVNDFIFGIFTKENKLIGTHHVKYIPDTKIGEIGVMIGDSDYWGKGVPLETRAALMDWFFNEFDADKIIAGCYSSNYPALYNFIRQNWKMYRIDKGYRTIDGKLQDFINYSMSRESWNDR